MTNDKNIITFCKSHIHYFKKVLITIFILIIPIYILSKYIRYYFFSKKLITKEKYKYNSNISQYLFFFGYCFINPI